MKKVENGHFVKVDYTGRLENGQVFDSSEDRGPLELEVGAGRIIKGFEEALIGMVEREEKTFAVSPEEGYGNRDESLQQSFQRSDLPGNFNPQKGEMVTLETAQGKEIPALVAETNDEAITIDLNHPLAGKLLNFEVKVVEINTQPTSPLCDPTGCGEGCCSC